METLDLENLNSVSGGTQYKTFKNVTCVQIASNIKYGMFGNSTPSAEAIKEKAKTHEVASPNADINTYLKQKRPNLYVLSRYKGQVPHVVALPPNDFNPSQITKDLAK